MEQNIFQNQYGGLDPTEKPNSPVNIGEDEDLQTSRLIRELMDQAKQAGKKIEPLDNQLDFDPIASAQKRWKDHYKWKGVSTARKLGSIGYGILDGLSNFGSKNAIQKIQDQEQQKFDNLKSTIPGRIDDQQKIVTNSQNLIQKLTQDQDKKASNKATIAFKKLLMNTTDATKRAQMEIEWERLNQTGQATEARVALMGAQKGLTEQKTETEKVQGSLPRNIFGAAQLDASGKLAPNFMKSFETLAGLQNKGKGRGANLQLRPESGNMTNVTMDDDGNVKLTPYKEQQIFNPNPSLDLSPEQRLTKIPGPVGGRNYPTSGPEFKRLQDTMYSSDLFDQGVTAMINDVYTGEFEKRSLFNDTGIGRKIREMTNNDPVSAESARASLNNQMMSAAQHIRTVIGRFPSVGFAEKLEAGLNAQGGTAPEKFAAQITQKYALAMAKASMAGRDDYNQFFHDPQFYDYMQKRSAALYKVAVEKKYRGGAPSLQQLMKDYAAEKQKNNVIDPRNSGPGIPYIKDPRIQQRQQYGNKIPGLRQN